MRKGLVVQLRGPLARAVLLAPRLRALATVEAATSGEMQTKFSQETRGMLEYGNLNIFFGGLERLVGSPHPKVRAMMEDEHTKRGDSAKEFTTSNYEVHTTSAIEWAFVATPDEPPSEGWPVEAKIRAALGGGDGAELAAIRASGAQPRRPLQRRRPGRRPWQSASASCAGPRPRGRSGAGWPRHGTR